MVHEVRSDDIVIDNGKGWKLMTNRLKGLQNVMEELFSGAKCSLKSYIASARVPFKQ